MRIVGKTIFLFWAINALSAAWAVDPYVYEVEPNDQVGQATPWNAPAQLLGEMAAGDQDAYILEIKDTDAAKRWQIELHGSADDLTKLDLLYLHDWPPESDDKGALTSKPPTVFSIATNGQRPRVARQLSLRPGFYVFALSHAKQGGAYRVAVTEATKQRVAKQVDNPSREAAHQVRHGSNNSYLSAGESWYRFSLNEKQAAQAVVISAQTVLGAPLSLDVFNDAPGANSAALVSANSNAEGKVALPGMSLKPGDYTIAIKGTADSLLRELSIQAGSLPVANQEIEPNNHTRGNMPNPIAIDAVVNGEISSTSDYDYFRFTVAADTPQPFAITVYGNDPDATIRLTLYDVEAQSIQSRDSKGRAILPALTLPIGQYQIGIVARGKPFHYRLGFEPEHGLLPYHELEPNDRAVDASPIGTKGFARGRLAGSETDFFQIAVSDEPQLWRVIAQGQGISALRYVDAKGSQIRKSKNNGGDRHRLDNLFLLPGTHRFTVAGKDSDYFIRARPLGPPNSNLELEPNNDIRRAAALTDRSVMIGSLSDAEDKDLYAFSLEADTRVRIVIKPPVDGTVRAYLYQGQRAMANSVPIEPGSTIYWDYQLGPGDYHVQLYPHQPSDGDYSIMLLLDNPLQAYSDREFNNDAYSAEALPADGKISGTVGGTRHAQDWYRLPALQQATPIIIDGATKATLALRTAESSKSLLKRVGEQWQGELAVDKEHFLVVSRRGAYQLELDVPGLTDKAVELACASTELSMSAKLAQSEVAAFATWGQQIGGQLIINNRCGTPLKVEIVHQASDFRVHPELTEAEIELAAGASQTIGFDLKLEPDLSSGRAISVAFNLMAGELLLAESTVVFTPSSEAELAEPYFFWALPEQLLGAINVAATKFGAQPQGDGRKSGHYSGLNVLFDDLIEIGRWSPYFASTAQRQPQDYHKPTVALAQGRSWPVVGALLNPTGTDDFTGYYLRDFSISASTDGGQLSPVSAGQLSSRSAEQTLLFDQPVQAKQLQLHPLNNQSPSGRQGENISLGELKYLVAPATDLTGGEGFNLADESLGGNVVWSQPAMYPTGWNRYVLTDKADAQRIRIKPGTTHEFVIGFHHQRATQVARVVWKQSDKAKEGERPIEVAISVATESPFGPWTKLGDWQLDPKQTRIDLDQPVWARYVKFSANAEEESRGIYTAEKIDIYERVVSDDYYSILGEWGYVSRYGPFEYYNPPTPPRRTRINHPNQSKDSAADLALATVVDGAVKVGKAEAWYRLQVPDDQNTLTLDLTGYPSLHVSAQLEDAKGKPVTLYPEPISSGQHLIKAYVESGQEYWLKISEPPRSVVFSWDTSGSVANYVPVIYNALLRYADQITPGLDLVNYVPFGGAPLLKSWLGHPYQLKRLLNDYPRDTNSSAAESSLMTAAEVMRGRPGQKAVVLITDAATNQDNRLWPILADVRPRVFAMGVTSAGAFGPNPLREQDLLQAWAGVNHGHYEYVINQGALNRAFARASAWLQEPVNYQLRVDASFTEDPGPASIAVTMDQQQQAVVTDAVEIILDASGSMLKRLDGKRRINIAKDALSEVIDQQIPDDAEVALRVFGHREANSCRTDLEVPLRKLDRDALKMTLAGINATNLAKTPIADSLERVQADLKGAKGRKLVVLLTDGEETCEGDPQAVINKLVDKGFDIRLNIVGFAIDDVELKQTFTDWARAGGGDYLDANDAAGLADSMARALQLPFTLRDQQGEIVAEGSINGDPLELAPGDYQLQVDGYPQLSQPIKLVPGETLELALGSGESR